jgi:hypothetical protein
MGGGSMAWFVALGFVGGAGVFLVAVALRRVILYWPVWNSDSIVSEGFSLERYEPMAGLLSEEDFVFLAAQPGYKPEMGAKLRRERRRIFRLYLRELAQDFHGLHREARALVAESPEQHSELVGLLMRQQVAFWRAIAALEMRLAASRLHLANVDVRGLLESIEAMRLDLARVAAPAL